MGKNKEGREMHLSRRHQHSFSHAQDNNKEDSHTHTHTNISLWKRNKRWCYLQVHLYDRLEKKFRSVIEWNDNFTSLPIFVLLTAGSRWFIIPSFTQGSLHKRMLRQCSKVKSSIWIMEISILCVFTSSPREDTRLFRLSVDDEVEFKRDVVNPGISILSARSTRRWIVKKWFWRRDDNRTVALSSFIIPFFWPPIVVRDEREDGKYFRRHIPLAVMYQRELRCSKSQDLNKHYASVCVCVCEYTRMIRHGDQFFDVPTKSIGYR